MRLYRAVGDKAVIATARRLGLTTPLPEGDPSVALGSATTTLLELTSAYAGVAGNRFPVEPTAFPAAKDGWMDWVLRRHRSLSDSEHDEMQQMLRAVVTRGTGRAAQLRHLDYGKTGTSQDNRDALFVGYAGNLVVGVWVGKDDNTPLKGVSGGTIPAHIWRDFMRDALGERPAPKPQPRPNPEGPVQPFDLPDLGRLLSGDNARVNLDRNGVTLGTEVGGVPIGVRIDRDGVRVDSRAAEPSGRDEQDPDAQP